MGTLRNQRHLAALLEGELGFYRRLFMLIDRQRDRLQSDPNQELTEDFEAIGELRGRIEASESLISRMRSEHQQAFDNWARTPEILDLKAKIAALVGECHRVAADCERIVQDKLAAYRVELAEMGRGRRLLASMALAAEGPRFVDKCP